LNIYCVAVYGWIFMQFARFFFGRNRPFRCTREFSFSLLGGASFRENAVKNCENYKKIGEKVCAHNFV